MIYGQAVGLKLPKKCLYWGERDNAIPTLMVRITEGLAGKEPRRVVPNFRGSLCAE
jgi:hypothetical protein